MRSKHKEDESPGIMMEPMIDCVFLLLIFFLVAATIRKKHKEIPVDLPTFGNTAEAPVGEADKPPLYLRVSGIEADDTGRVTDVGLFLREGVAVGELGPGRQVGYHDLAGEIGPQRPVFIEVFGDVRYGHVMKIIGLLQLHDHKVLGLRVANPHNPA
ncbi:MAG: ExbD/TolR family protein [Planctomycetota bacterium]